jgi:hypothetical protein
VVFIFYQRVYESLAVRLKFGKVELVKKVLAERGFMKFLVRRALFALITTPVILLAYVVIYFGLGLVADSGSVGEFASVAPSVAIGYFVALLILPSLYRLVDKVVA